MRAAVAPCPAPQSSWPPARRTFRERAALRSFREGRGRFTGRASRARGQRPTKMVVTRVAAAMEMPARKVFPNMSAPTSTLALSAALKAAAAASGSAVALGGCARAVRVAAGRGETVRSEGEATAARGRRKAAVCSDREAAGATAAAMSPRKHDRLISLPTGRCFTRCLGVGISFGRVG